MSEYVNSFSINISEMVRLSFSEEAPENAVISKTAIVTVAMHYDFLKTMSAVIGQAVAQHEHQLVTMKETNKGLN